MTFNLKVNIPDMNDHTHRFSDRVENYIKYRPSYPAELIALLISDYGLDPSQKVADIGSGTGISSELFLKAGNAVVGIEPNGPMREASLQLLKPFYPDFEAVDGTAEASGLSDAQFHWLVAAQAFHWFDHQHTLPELQRIALEDAYLMILWNERLENTPFLQAYEQLIIRHATDYRTVDHRKVLPASLAFFFEGQRFESHLFDNVQIFDFEGLKGRLMSSSYVPPEGSEAADKMLEELAELFDQFEVEGQVEIHYDTILHIGKLSKGR